MVFIFGIFCAFIPHICFCQPQQVPAAIEIASNVSDGEYSLRRIVETARESGFKVVIPADRDFMRWEYGVWPLRNIIKKRVEDPSIWQFGFRAYRQILDEVRRQSPDMLILSGIESAPHYYWRGRPFSDTFTLRNWHKHLLTVGLEKEDDMRGLPVVGNPAMRRIIRSDALFTVIIAAVFLCIGIILLVRSRHRYLGTILRRHIIAGIGCIGAGALFLLNSYPFGEPLFDQYGFDGERPYQNYIDYVHAHGGLTFWMHPEVENSEKIGFVTVKTPEYVLSLSRTYDYTGFALFYDGLKQVGVPGGLWDELLGEYCRGARRAPVWAIGGLGFEKGDLRHALADLRTMLLVERFDEPSVMDALRFGRSYTVRGKRSADFLLDVCAVQDTETSASAGIGQEVLVRGIPRIVLKGHLLDGHAERCTIQLIRNGELAQRFSVDIPFDFTWEDTGAPVANDTKQYYRIEIIADGLHCIGNPIFVQRMKSP